VSKKRPDRTQRRERERKVKKLVRATERLAATSAGGTRDKAIVVESSVQIEIKIGGMRCPQCDGVYTVIDHRSVGQGVRPVDVKCQTCGTPRTLWFEIRESEPS
jgi:predicted Zn finger-like uncharacterized protein